MISIWNRWHSGLLYNRLLPHPFPIPNLLFLWHARDDELVPARPLSFPLDDATCRCSHYVGQACMVRRFISVAFSLFFIEDFLKLLLRKAKRGLKNFFREVAGEIIWEN